MAGKYASGIEFSGGGLLDDVDVTFVSAVTAQHSFKTGGTEMAVLKLGMTIDETGEPHEEILNGGMGDKWTTDGSGFIPTSSQAMLPKAFAVAILAASMIEAGFDAKLLEPGDWKVIEGHRFHILRRAAKAKDGTVKKNDKGYDITEFTVSKYLGTVTGGAAKTAGAAGGGANADAIYAKIMELLAGANGSMAKSALMQPLFAAFTGKMQPQDIVAALDDKLLAAKFKVTNGVISL